MFLPPSLWYSRGGKAQAACMLSTGRQGSSCMHAVHWEARLKLHACCPLGGKAQAACMLSTGRQGSSCMHAVHWEARLKLHACCPLGGKARAACMLSTGRQGSSCMHAVHWEARLELHACCPLGGKAQAACMLSTGRQGSSCMHAVHGRQGSSCMHVVHWEARLKLHACCPLGGKAQAACMLSTGRQGSSCMHAVHGRQGSSCMHVVHWEARLKLHACCPLCWGQGMKLIKTTWFLLQGWTPPVRPKSPTPSPVKVPTATQQSSSGLSITDVTSSDEVMASHVQQVNVTNSSLSSGRQPEFGLGVRHVGRGQLTGEAHGRAQGETEDHSPASKDMPQLQFPSRGTQKCIVVVPLLRWPLWTYTLYGSPFVGMDVE